MDTKEKYEFSKLYLSEYCHFDGEDDNTTNIFKTMSGKS